MLHEVEGRDRSEVCIGIGDGLDGEVRGAELKALDGACRTDLADVDAAQLLATVRVARAFAAAEVKVARAVATLGSEVGGLRGNDPAHGLASCARGTRPSK